MAKTRELKVCDNMFEAKIIKGLLESNGIQCAAFGDGSSGMLPFTVDGMGEVRIMVDENDYELARALIDAEPLDESHEEGRQ